MNYVEKLVQKYPELKPQQKSIQAFCDAIVTSYKRDGKIMLCGNGGSAADAEHITGELLKGFMTKRPMSEKKKKIFSLFKCNFDFVFSCM